MPSGSELRIFLAGRVAIEADGVRMGEERFPGRQGRLLFAYLVAEQGRPVPRDELAEALWGQAPPATWEKALTVLASKLRGLLAECGLDSAKVLTSAFGSYRLNLPDGAWVDVIAAADVLQEAQTALAADDLEQAKAVATGAASLARPSFLPGENGSWVEAKRRELTDILRRALDCLAEACLRSGDEVEAAKWAEETIALDPYRDTGYRRLMAAHAAAGNRAEALRVYERCRQLLATELGAYPSPETESIYRELLGGASPNPRAAAPEAAPVPVLELEPAPSPSVGCCAGPTGSHGDGSTRGAWPSSQPPPPSSWRPSSYPCSRSAARHRRLSPRTRLLPSTPPAQSGMLFRSELDRSRSPRAQAGCGSRTWTTRL